MSFFRKKPIIIEAEQWFRGKVVPGVHFEDGIGPVVDTLEGQMLVSEGDWIITGVRGERYPCKPDIFAMTYEEVKD